MTVHAGIHRLRNGIGMGSGCTHFSDSGVWDTNLRLQKSRAEGLKAEFWTKYLSEEKVPVTDVSSVHVDNLKAKNAVEDSEFR